MTTDETKILRALPSFGKRAHTKLDLIHVCDGSRIRIVERRLDMIKHFFVETERSGKIFFFDLNLPDSEYAYLGFSSVCFYLLGGKFGSGAAAGNVSQTHLRATARRLALKIVCPDIENGASRQIQFAASPSRRHLISALKYNSSVLIV